MCSFCQSKKTFGITFININGQELSWCQECERKIMYQTYQNLKNTIN